MMLVPLILLSLFVVGLIAILAYSRAGTAIQPAAAPEADLDPETEQLIWAVSAMEALAPKARRAAESGVCPEGCPAVRTDKNLDPIRWWIGHLSNHGERNGDG